MYEDLLTAKPNTTKRFSSIKEGRPLKVSSRTPKAQDIPQI